MEVYNFTKVFVPSIGSWFNLRSSWKISNPRYFKISQQTFVENTINYWTSFILIRYVLNFIERLYAKPVLTHGANNQTVLVGETARFNCEFLSDMHPYVFWMYFAKDEVIYHYPTDPSEGYAKEMVVYNDTNKIKEVRLK